MDPSCPRQKGLAWESAGACPLGWTVVYKWGTRGIGGEQGPSAWVPWVGEHLQTVTGDSLWPVEAAGRGSGGLWGDTQDLGFTVPVGKGPFWVLEVC